MNTSIDAVVSGGERAALVRGDAYDLIRGLPRESIDLIITSPPYWGLRNYEAEHNWDILNQWQGGKHAESAPSYEWYREHGGLLGLEPLPEWYIFNIAEILNLCQKALKLTGSLWLNLGDTYFARWSSIRQKGRQGLNGDDRLRRKTPMGGYRQEKQLLLIPTRVAIALQERRWILRNDLIWYKPNVPPRPFDDRLGMTHEHFFHFVKRPKEGRAKYYYDLSEAGSSHDVQKVNVVPGKDRHSASFPPKLIEPRIRSSCPLDGVVLDPFAGVGTALEVAVSTGRRVIGFEINQRFLSAATRRLQNVARALF
jgi:site-specific DNA-methyltransferase (cytosine-N4-specific)